MKNLYLFIILSVLAVSCEKNSPVVNESARPAPVQTPVPPVGPPYGTTSMWKCIGGDTMFTDTLKISLYYTEKKPGCDTYYYEFSFPIWSEYDYNLEVSECTQQRDTLFVTDFNSSKIVAFIPVNK
jgi:hypothetical protein